MTLPEDVTLTPVDDPGEGDQISQHVFDHFDRTSITQNSNESSTPTEGRSKSPKQNFVHSNNTQQKISSFKSFFSAENKYAEQSKSIRKPEKVRFATSQDQSKVVLTTTTTTNSGGPEVRTVVKVTKGAGGNRQLYSCSGVNYSNPFDSNWFLKARPIGNSKL